MPQPAWHTLTAPPPPRHTCAQSCNKFFQAKQRPQSATALRQGPDTRAPQKQEMKQRHTQQCRTRGRAAARTPKQQTPATPASPKLHTQLQAQPGRPLRSGARTGSCAAHLPCCPAKHGQQQPLLAMPPIQPAPHTSMPAVLHPYMLAPRAPVRQHTHLPPN